MNKVNIVVSQTYSPHFIYYYNHDTREIYFELSLDSEFAVIISKTIIILVLTFDVKKMFTYTLQT